MLIVIEYSYSNPTPHPHPHPQRQTQPPPGRSVVQTTRKVSAINSVQKLSKSELSWRGRRPFKVLQKLDARLEN